jgi:hypothetical protein
MATGAGIREDSKAFFFTKKKQKTFDYWLWWSNSYASHWATRAN